MQLTHLIPVALNLAFTFAHPQSILPTPVPNPWAADCPIPSGYTITKFASMFGKTKTISLSLSYNNTGSFSCPRKEGNGLSYSNNVFEMLCDVDGLTRVQTDGIFWIYIEENFYCPSPSLAGLQGAHPYLGGIMGTNSVNYTLLYDDLTCTPDAISYTHCTLKKPFLKIPIQGYRGGPVVGNAPLSVNGTYLPNCPTLADRVIVTNYENCTTPVVGSNI